MESPNPTIGCLTLGSIAAFALLVAGIAVPLAGGTDFDGLPRVLGALLISSVWLLGMVSAARSRQWGWLVALVVFSPLLFVAYGTLISEDLTFPDAWSEFDSPPWHLIALLLTPLLLLLYGLRSRDRRNG